MQKYKLFLLMDEKEEEDRRIHFFEVQRLTAEGKPALVQDWVAGTLAKQRRD
jgi:hypothetical protein